MKGTTEDLIGSSIGHILIIDVLGEGGMGTVYLGQDEKLRRKVAVKAIHDERRLHEHAKARFLQEARILSQLNHHNICAVHEFIEGEECDYLVLELVEGRNLRAAMKMQLPIDQKLSIARQLLEVLAAVHGAGVIHRDLKPENIMIRPDGDIAVLDFGLARSVDDDGARSPDRPTLDLEALDSVARTREIDDPDHRAFSIQVATNQGTVVGTAGYMSPEQARAEPATAASDMYAVGMIFQELFTGSPPFDRRSSSVELVLKAAVGESLPVAGVPADLKALIERLKSFAPGARPSSVDALDQLQQFIDLPKRRRRRAVVAAVWLVLVALAGGMTIQSVRASRAADRANREADAARSVSDFLVNLFEESNPEQARGASRSAEEILQRGADRISVELAEQPLTRARLLMTIGRVYGKMGLYTEALALVEQAMELRRHELGEAHGEVGEALADMGHYRFKKGESERAEQDLGDALTILEGAYGGHHVEVANALMDLGNLHRSSGRFDEAEAELRRALVIYEAEFGPDDVRKARCVANIAIAMAMQGDVDGAEPLFRRAYEIQATELGDDHPSTSGARSNLAIALKSLGRYDEAETLYLQSVETTRKVLGADHPRRTQTITEFADFLRAQGRGDEAAAIEGNLPES